MNYPIIALLRGSHGLSARRARRTKSSRPEGPKAGPKGRQLEVGARRAPRPLVASYVPLKALKLTEMQSENERNTGVESVSEPNKCKMVLGTNTKTWKMRNPYDVTGKLGSDQMGGG